MDEEDEATFQLPVLLIEVATCYTFWNILFIIFKPWFIDLHLSCLLTAFISFGIFRVDPIEVNFWVGQKQKIRYQLPWCVDLALHWLPLIYVFVALPIQRDMFATEFTIFVFLTYVIFFNACAKYQANASLSIFLCLAAVCIRLCL